MKTNSLFLRIILGIGLLLLASFSTLPLIPPHAVSADAPATRFSAERAMTDLAVIAKEPHGTGSEAQERVREYIIAQVETMGLSAKLQTSGPLSNILVRIPGSDSTGTVLVTGHYDSHPPAPGAGDNGISVVQYRVDDRAQAEERNYK
jgi:acetylornithine deacetylase/succinyl-diaminopimelate desuccinylase-like protein